MRLTENKYLFITKVGSHPDYFDSFIKEWRLTRAKNNRKFFINLEDSSLLEFTEFSLLEELPKLLLDNESIKSDEKLTSFLNSDLHQELLEYREHVVFNDTKQCESTYIQMRHVEVPLKVYDGYLKWRKETIFNYVKQLSGIENFVAYHSLFSTQPGVMLIASFSCEPEEYMAGFNNESYKEIIRQAGNQYILGGKEGLYVKLYKAL